MSEINGTEGDKALTIIKQLAHRMTVVGFPNNPRGAEAELFLTFTESVEVWAVKGMHPLLVEPVYVLVVNKGHIPLPAWHVVDFRVGGNIYGDPAKG
jgi:hypothetical protein